MQTNFKDKLRYRFEKYLNKGGASIFVSLFVVFVALFILMVFLRWILANESEKYASVVILSGEDKEEMDDLIAKRIPDKKTTTIITTTGDYANINELKRVSIKAAKSVILLANCSESAFQDEKINSDVQSIKSIMAIISCQDGRNQLPIIAEIFNQDKRELISYFQDENIIALDSWEIMGKLLVQTSLTSALEMVYNEILSFDGCEIYFYQTNWNAIGFGQLPFYFKDGIPLGVYNDNDGMTLRPGREYKMKKEDHIIILAEDDSTINLETNSIHNLLEINLIPNKLEQNQKSILILGWHSVAEIFISESADYLKDNSSFDIYFKNPNEEFINRVEELKKIYPAFKITLTDADPLEIESLTAAKPFDYDNIVILSQEFNEQQADRIDSDTLIILLLLRKIKSTQPNVNTKIITQVLNSDNQEIITQTDVDDFIISNKLITMILAQLSEEPLIMKFYEDIFSEDGSKIYVKSIRLYCDQFPLKTTFGDLIGLADQRDEICLGIRKGSQSKNANENFGVTLNLDKNAGIELEENDFLVVLSEDEL